MILRVQLYELYYKQSSGHLTPYSYLLISYIRKHNTQDASLGLERRSVADRDFEAVTMASIKDLVSC